MGSKTGYVTIDELTEKVQTTQTKITETSLIAAGIKSQHQQLLTWAEIFDTASIEEKKMIASHMIKAVTITRDYGLSVDFNISEAQYLNGLQMG